MHLGGLGKTQTALKYADSHRQRYPSGVFFLSARSQATLTADLFRICDVLQLNEGSDPLQKFKNWLSRKDNTRWLLILDNADDLESVQLLNYIPKTQWGHIVITSRDQIALGSVAKTGCLMDQLAVEEAISLLLEEADIHSPSTEDFEHARDIVSQFGCLPIAINQAGAYIRSRQKGLSAFKKLCKERQRHILEFKPRLAEYDQTVFTTWSMNFEQVERESREAHKLLLMFCYLDAANITEALLDRACAPQKRWNQGGEVFEEDPVHAGIDEEVVQLIKDEVKLDDAVEVLRSFSLIYVNLDEEIGLRKFSVHPLVQYCASQRVSAEVQEHWRSQATALICHAFPRDEILEPL